MKIQCQNRGNNINIEIEGTKANLYHFFPRLDCKSKFYKRFYRRIKNGYSPLAAIFAPKDRRKRNTKQRAEAFVKGRTLASLIKEFGCPSTWD